MNAHDYAVWCAANVASAVFAFGDQSWRHGLGAFAAGLATYYGLMAIVKACAR